MKYVFTFLLLLSLEAIAQQEVRGIVVNGVDGTSLAAASVFVNNSSKGTITGNDGKFVIAGITETNFQLVVSYVGFETVSININAQNINQFQTVKLFPRERSLEEISLMPIDKRGWQKWGLLFTGLFIGTTGFAENCSIQNPAVIRFYQNKKTKMLHAYSDGAITIRNDALGYTIDYLLEDFQYDSVSGSMHYLGYASYKDLQSRGKSKTKRWVRNRHLAYRGSILNFMRALYVDSVAEEGFTAKDKIKIYAGDSVFNSIYRGGSMAQFVKISDRIYAVSIGFRDTTMTVADYVELTDTTNFPVQKLTTFDAIKKQKIFYFNNYLEVKYKLPDYNSELTLQTEDPVIVEANGFYFNPTNLSLSGFWADQRMAYTLPFDYIDEQ